LIEEIRAEAAAGKSEGVVLLNEALTIDGHPEIGPLLRGPQGQLAGAGVINGAKAVKDIFELLNRLPVNGSRSVARQPLCRHGGRA
jgi:hypothetical protein